MKQAANKWYKELANFLLRQGFTRSRIGHCLFARAETEGHTFILVWVDIIVASRSMTVIFDVEKALEATFHMEDRGRLHWFLSLRFRREEGKVTVDQERYIETMLERFQMDQCKPSRTPADLNLKLQSAQRTETKKWTRGSTEAWLDHFFIWPNRRGQTSCSQSTLCPGT